MAERLNTLKAPFSTEIDLQLFGRNSKLIQKTYMEMKNPNDKRVSVMKTLWYWWMARLSQ